MGFDLKESIFLDCEQSERTKSLASRASRGLGDSLARDQVFAERSDSKAPLLVRWKTTMLRLVWFQSACRTARCWVLARQYQNSQTARIFSRVMEYTNPFATRLQLYLAVRCCRSQTSHVDPTLIADAGLFDSRRSKRSLNACNYQCA